MKQSSGRRKQIVHWVVSQSEFRVSIQVCLPTMEHAISRSVVRLAGTAGSLRLAPDSCDGSRRRGGFHDNENRKARRARKVRHSALEALDHSLDPEVKPVEIEQQAKSQTRGLPIIQALRTNNPGTAHQASSLSEPSSICVFGVLGGSITFVCQHDPSQGADLVEPHDPRRD